MINTHTSFSALRLFDTPVLPAEPVTRRKLLDNSTTSVSGDDLHPVFNQNNTVLTVNGLNNHPLLEGDNNTLTVSGDGGTVNVTGDNNQILVKGFHITTYDMGNNNSVSARGVSDPVHVIPPPPRAAPTKPNASAPAPAPVPVPAPAPGRRLLSVTNVTQLGLRAGGATSIAAQNDATHLGAVVGGVGIVAVLFYLVRRFFAKTSASQVKQYN